MGHAFLAALSVACWCEKQNEGACQILVEPAQVLAVGCHPAQVPVATKMVIVRIAVPQISLLTVPASAKGKEEEPLLPQQPSRSSDTDAAAPDRKDRTPEAETSGSDLDRTLDEEQLVAQLQTYFQESIRCT